MKQQKIANWLKGIVIFLAILGIVYGVEISFLPMYMAYSHIFHWWMLLFCYIILFLFWNVCTQIGKGNSFSLENATAFHQIGLCGGAIVLGFVAEFTWVCIKNCFSIPLLIFIGFKIAAFIIFIILCEALSKLIFHAYEIRQENELTI